MSLDKLIAAATDYFLTGADVHRRALAGGGGKITDLSEPKTEGFTPTADTAKPARKATKPVAAANQAENDAMLAHAAKAAAEASVAAAKKHADAAAAVTASLEADARAAAELKARDAAAEAKAIEDENARVAAAEAAAMCDDLDGPAISYEEDIRPVLRAKSLANRDKLVALLSEFKVKSGQELTADQYPAFLAGLKAI